MIGVRVLCPVCGKKCGSRMPRGGDGTLLYPRRHKAHPHAAPMLKLLDGSCAGTLEEATTWL